MKKLFILLLTAAVFINSVSFFASAFGNSEYEKQWIEELRYITENGAAKDPEFEFFGEGDGGKILPSEQVEYFRLKKNAVLSFKYEYDETVSESVKKSFGDVINIEFYYSYNSYMTYKLHTKEKDVITVAEIEESLKMKKPEGIVGIIIKNINPYVNITEYTFTTKKGWLTPNDKTYYVTEDGTLQTKSCSIDGVRYSFSSDGVCKGRYTGWTKSSKGRRYYKNGELVKNKWLKTKSGKRYYAGAEGYMRTGWAMIKEKGICFFDENGIWDGKKYYTGYQPNTMADFLMDFDFSPELEYEYNINYKYKFRKFEGIEKVIEILEKDKDKRFIYDERVDDEIYSNENIYHGDDDIVIRAKDYPHIIFSKDEEGNSYFYCKSYGFGCKLSDKDAFDKVKELIS